MPQVQVQVLLLILVACAGASAGAGRGRVQVCVQVRLLVDSNLKINYKLIEQSSSNQIKEERNGFLGFSKIKRSQRHQYAT